VKSKENHFRNARVSILLIILFLSTGLLFSQEMMSNSMTSMAAGEMVDNPSISLEINFHNKQIYYPNDNIYVRVSIKNNGSSIYRFRLADNRIFNLDIDLVNMANISQRMSDRFINTRSSNQRVFFREISLQAGEEYSFIENISDYRMVDEGLYVVNAYFYPELVEGMNSNPLRSNRLTLSVEPGFRREDRIELIQEEEALQLVRSASLAPDEVIVRTLEARMHNRREEFFLYLDEEQLYLDDPFRARSYTPLSERDRLQVINEYKELLWSETIDEGISSVPSSYEILQTQYSPVKGEVQVRQRYDNGNFVEVKRFFYEMEQRDGIWFLVRYRVVNEERE
jgi:hypothetical protein